MAHDYSGWTPVPKEELGFHIDDFLRVRKPPAPPSNLFHALDCTCDSDPLGRCVVHRSSPECEARTALCVVDDFLVMNWVPPPIDGDYTKALRQLVSVCIAIENDPQVSEPAARRKAELDAALNRAARAERRVRTNEQRLEYYEDLVKHLLGTYVRLFPYFAWTDSKAAVNLMAQQIESFRTQPGYRG